jgi:RNA polymerase sigma-70 factor (sigma-E family)
MGVIDHSVEPVRAEPADSLDAVDRLFRSEYRPLVVVAAFLVDDVATAEECVQDAFAGLVRHWDSLRDKDSAPAYLRRSVVNLSRSRLRRLRTARRHAIETASVVPAPEEAVLLAEEHRAVLRALRRLPRRQRECLVLRFYLHATTDEIAEALAISVGSVKAYVHRGLHTLEELLEAQ